MLLVIILTWGKDIIIQPCPSIEWAKDKKKLFGENTEFIIHDSAFLCPIRMDIAWRELDVSEQIEWLHTQVYPQLEAEGKMIRKNGRMKYAMEKLR